MQRLILKFLLVVCLLAGTKPAAGFSLLGIVEGWQVPAIGHNLTGDIGGVKNLGEEYRMNLPVITYGFDSTFLNYFGSNGVAAVDAAFAILNSLPPVSSLGNTLEEYPLKDPATGNSTTFQDSRRVNLRAQANNLLDIKSMALGVVVEELGLADPERHVWTLRDKRTVGTPPVTNYLVMMRNFDPDTFEPTPYVNGTRYTYQVFEDDQGEADALEIPVDPEFAFSSVAGRYLSYGNYYTYLTRDDIGGLRYLYSPDNLNVEPFPANTVSFTPDRSNPILLTNLDLTLLSIRGTNLSPAQISNLYPGIIIAEAIPQGQIVVTNAPVLVTNQVPLLFFTNFGNLQIVSNIDLTSFSSFVRTNGPAAVLAQFPDLLIASTNVTTTQEVQVASIVLTNAPKNPWDDPFTIRQILVTNFVTNLAFRYQYTFRNVITNFASPFNIVRREIIGLDKEPWSTAQNPIYRTNTVDYVVAEPSGGILIVPTNLIGYVFAPFPAATNVLVSSNIVFLTNFVDTVTGLPRTVQETHWRFFTNVQYAVYPIEVLPFGQTTNVVVTNGVGTNILIQYSYRFANVITNYSSPTTPATYYSYDIIPDPLNPLIIRTNVSTRQVVLPVASGGFLIDTNLTGYEFTGIQTPYLVSVTNVVFDITNPVTGRRVVEEFVYTFTNTVYLVYPFIQEPAPASLLRGGVDKITFVKLGDGTIQGNNFNFTNRFQVRFWTNGNSQVRAFQIVQTQPDILFVAEDLGTTADDVDPFRMVRNQNFQNQAALNSQGNTGNQAGPGVNFPPITITFSKIGPFLINTFPGFVDETSLRDRFLFSFRPFLWGSFDGSTNPPVIFPQDITLEQIEARTAGRQSE